MSDAYLNAMGITSWVTREASSDSSSSEWSFDDSAKEAAQGNQQGSQQDNQHNSQQVNTHSQPVAKLKLESEAKPNETRPPSELSGSSASNEPRVETNVATADVDANVETNVETNLSSKTSPEHSSVHNQTSTSVNVSTQPIGQERGFLVLPSNKRWIPEELLVVCRHQPGQPSESFWSRGQPSKTIRNLLHGLHYLLTESYSAQWLNRINYAQLATTALSENTQQTERVLTEIKPKAILVLGEHTANLIAGEARSMSEWQLKNWQTSEGIPFIVTYHPYEIYQSPILKKQVVQDLLRLSHLLHDDSVSS